MFLGNLFQGKKSLLIVSAFFLITSVSTENAFGMKRLGNTLGHLWEKLFDQPAAQRTRTEDTTEQVFQQPIEQATVVIPTQAPAVQVPAPAPAAEVPVMAAPAQEPVSMQVEGQESRASSTSTATTTTTQQADTEQTNGIEIDFIKIGQLRPTQEEQTEDPDAAADMAAPAAGDQIAQVLDATGLHTDTAKAAGTDQASTLILRPVANAKQLTLNVRVLSVPQNEGQFLIMLTPEQMYEFIQQFGNIDRCLIELRKIASDLRKCQTDILENQESIIENQGRQEKSHEQFQEMLQEHGEEVHEISEGQAATTAEVKRLVDETHQNREELVRFEAGTHVEFDRLNVSIVAVQRQNENPILMIATGGVIVFAMVLTGGGFHSLIPLFGPIRGTLLTILGIGGWYAAYTRVCQPLLRNHAVQCLYDYIARRIAPAAAPVVPAHAAQGQAAPAATAAAQQAQAAGAAAPQAVAQIPAAGAPAAQTPPNSMFGRIGKFFRRKK